MADERDKLINDLRREIDRLTAELKHAKEMQRVLFNLVPEEKLISALIAANIKGDNK